MPHSDSPAVLLVVLDKRDQDQRAIDADIYLDHRDLPLLDDSVVDCLCGLVLDLVQFLKSCIFVLRVNI